MPHGMCFSWHPDVLALHAVSDTIIALSYFCIPVLLLTFVRRRPALHRFGFCFAAFIVSCGLTHLMDVWTIWHPDYWVSGAFKALTAVASLGTVAALLPLMPYARALQRFGTADRVHLELESKYRLIVETSTDGIWLVDRASRTTFVNTRLTELLGFSFTEMIGKPSAGFLFDPSASPALTLNGKAAASGPFELCFRRKDGSPVWTQTQLTPIHDADAEVIGTAIRVTDTTERQHARLALAQSERRYEMLAEAMPHAVFTSRPDGSMDYCNGAWYELTGVSRADTRPDDWVSALHPDDAARALEAWRRALESGEPFEVQMRIRRAGDGMYRWFVSRAMPVHDASGAIVQWVGSTADIHDFKLADETRSVLDTMGHAIAIDNDEGSVEYASPNWLQLTGCGFEKLADWREFIHTDDLATVERHSQAARDMPLEVQQFEMRVRAADGSYRWFLVRTAALAAAGTHKRRLTTLTDIDDLKRTKAAFGLSETRYRALTDAMPQMIWIVDRRGQLEYVNERWSTYTGLVLEPGGSQLLTSIVHPDDLAVLQANHDALRGQRNHECELRIRRHDGAYRWYLLRTVPLGKTDDSSFRWIVTATDIEERKSAEAALAQSAAELTHLALHDPLTGLPNRIKLMDHLAVTIAQAQSTGTEIAVLYLDIDRFKAVNDMLGHTAGDQLLIEIAGRLKSALRSVDMASRFGGDEFVFVFTVGGTDDATQIAQRLQDAVRWPMELQGKRVIVSSSVGISMFPRDGPAAVDLIQKADAAMYAAKQAGRDAWRFYTAAQTSEPAVPALELEVQLREAIALEQFVVYFQPIVGVTSGHPVGAEALVRWAHPDRGLLAPGEFIPFAEDHGLIAPIGELVLHAVCAELRRLDLRLDDEFSIAINVSAHQFQKPGFVEWIASTIEAHGIDERRLEIEITESVVMGDTAAVVTTLNELQALGVKLSIDDFGTGYSSLAYLRNFPIHTLKIDRSFVSDITRNSTDRAIAKTIVTLAHSLGMRVVAEGVETEEQRDVLRSFDADCMQGYLVARPLSPDDFDAFMVRHRSGVR